MRPQAIQALPAAYAQATVIDTGGTIFQGLIDLHNHLSYNFLPLWSAPRRFANRNIWREHEPSYKYEVAWPYDLIAKNVREGMGITAFVPRPLTSGAKAQGRFGKPDFVYLEQENVYRCPAGEDLIYRYTSVEDGMTMHSYWSSNCQTCALHDQCTTGKERRVRRWEHEAVVEAMERRLDRKPQAMRIRRQTVEHPFGTLKSWMGSTHFQMKTLKHVRTEVSLHILAYNFKRRVAILGVRPMIAAIQT